MPGAPGVTIAVVNKWKQAANDELAHYLPALQRQLQEDVQSVWHVGADTTLGFVPYNKLAPRSVSWILEVRPRSNIRGALGYHIDPSNRPTSYVFAEDTLKAGCLLPVTLSHELIEMRVDQTCNLVNRVKTVTYAREIADPTEADEYAYEIDGVYVSDFVTPAWFTVAGNPPFDFKGHCTSAGQLLPGGYCSEYTNALGWHQVFANDAPKHQQGVGRPGSSGRTARRFTGR